MKGITSKRIIQLGIMVKDIEKAAKEWGDLLGVEATISTTCGYDVTKAMYRGEPCNGVMKQAAFNFENIQIELVSPVGDDPTVWKEGLDEMGEGLHHIAFLVDDIKQSIEDMESEGNGLMQYGQWPAEPKNGQYAYMDTREKLKTIVEIMEV